MSSAVVIIVLAVSLFFLVLGVLIYCLRRSIRQFCEKTLCHRKKRVHEITAPVRPSGENEIVLAVTQRRENTRPTMGSSTTATTHSRVVRHTRNVTELTRTRSQNGHGGHGLYDVHPPSPSYRLPPPYHHNNHRTVTVTRHQSFPSQQRPRGFVSGSEYPSPLVSNLSSLQSLLMSSQVAVFNSSTERLSLSSQNQVPLQSISLLHQQRLQQQEGQAGGFTVPIPSLLSLHSPSTTSIVRSSSDRLPQPSYFDEAPPSYQQSLLIRKLRESERSRKVTSDAKKIEPPTPTEV